jgi:hypothetical protein
MKAGAFDSAPADLKQRWQMAGDSASKKDYLGAVTNLMSVFSKAQTLSPEQNAALNEAWLVLGNEAFRAGNNGDKRALQAVLMMRASPYGRSAGER